MSTRTVGIVCAFVALSNFGLALVNSGGARVVELALGVTALVAAVLAFAVDRGVVGDE